MKIDILTLKGSTQVEVNHEKSMVYFEEYGEQRFSASFDELMLVFGLINSPRQFLYTEDEVKYIIMSVMEYFYFVSKEDKTHFDKWWQTTNLNKARKEKG